MLLFVRLVFCLMMSDDVLFNGFLFGVVGVYVVVVYFGVILVLWFGCLVVKVIVEV